MLCEKCENLYFPEVDADWNVSIGCKSPSVIDVFCNFMRLYKCKYYRKISYVKMLKETKNSLQRLIWYNRKRKPVNKHSFSYVIDRNNEYLEYKNYLFEIIQ